jgi:hypothetical protein
MTSHIDELEKEFVEFVSKNGEDKCPTELIRRYYSILSSSKHPVTADNVPMFHSRFPTLFNMISAKSCDKHLLEVFLAQLENVQSGKKQLEETEKDLACILNERYVVPKLRQHGEK